MQEEHIAILGNAVCFTCTILFFCFADVARLRKNVRWKTMDLDYMVGVIIGVAFLIYLLYQLFKPEKF